ncbi:MAG: hypothetical protein HY804_13420 [Nitrospinae bacterium]|nr:hypothetical protein [Nitrospinota bacterium]
MTSPHAPFTALKSVLTGAGFTISKESPDGFTAESTVTLAKWALGSRKARRRISIRLDAGTRTVHLREALTETSLGFPPPAFLSESWKQKGTRKTATLAGHGPGGGGEIRFGELRDELKSLVERAGWRFMYEAAVAP